MRAEGRSRVPTLKGAATSLQPAHHSDYFRAESANELIPEIFRRNQASVEMLPRVADNRFVDANTNPVIT